LLIDVELFGWPLQYVRVDTNADKSVLRAYQPQIRRVKVDLTG